MNERLIEYRKIVDKYIELTKRKYPIVDLLILTGSVARNTATLFSDLDIFAVAENGSEIAYPSFLYKNNIVEVGFKSWNFLEGIGSGEDFWSVGAAHILESKIVYFKSETVKNRFLELRKQLKSNIQTNDKYHLELLRKELQFFSIEEIALLQFHKENNDLISAKRTLWTTIIFLSKTLARINKTYLTSNWDKNTLEVFEFEILPENYEEKIRKLSRTVEFEEMIEISRELKIQTRQLLMVAYDRLANKISPLSNDKVLKEGILSITGYIQKARAAIARRDLLGVSYCIAEIQLWMAKLLANLKNLTQIEYQNYFHYNSDIDYIYQEMGYPDLIGSVSTANFGELEIKLDQLEQLLLLICNQHHMEINSYDQISEIPAKLFL